MIISHLLPMCKMFLPKNREINFGRGKANCNFWLFLYSPELLFISGCILLGRLKADLVRLCLTLRWWRCPQTPAKGALPLWNPALAFAR